MVKVNSLIKVFVAEVESFGKVIELLMVTTYDPIKSKSPVLETLKLDVSLLCVEKTGKFDTVKVGVLRQSGVNLKR